MGQGENLKIPRRGNLFVERSLVCDVCPVGATLGICIDKLVQNKSENTTGRTRFVEKNEV
jgi:hypothetical protein